jgi:hypothetical protein
MADALNRTLLRRAELCARIAEQRRDVERSIAGLAGPIAVIDRAMDLGRFMRAHPVAVGGAVAVLVALRTRSIVRVVTRGFGAWRLLRKVQAMLVRFGA